MVKHCESDRVLLVIRESAVLSRLSKSPGPCESTEAYAVLCMGALNDARTIRYEMFFNVRSKADMSQLKLPHVDVVQHVKFHTYLCTVRTSLLRTVITRPNL